MSHTRLATETASHPQDGAREFAPIRRRIRVAGIVQGVGFRPFVFRLAKEMGLTGWVANDATGVTIEFEGPAERIDEAQRRLVAEAPPLARITGVDARAVTPSGEDAFEIRASRRTEPIAAQVTPDSATCDACVIELFDPRDRRYRYPFLNCTDCGPRFTIVCGVPYDRDATTMARFTMCENCLREYRDPINRRFHAQPNACPECGPHLRYHPAHASDDAVADPLLATAESLAAGAIVAVKGLGGYHLACRADDEAVVSRLRRRKHRAEKAFAILVADVSAARRFANLSDDDVALLTSRARPIVLAPRRPGTPIAAAVAPHSAELGLLLPYTPLHHLLIADAVTRGIPALVLTSGNVSDEPIAYADDDALVRLAGVADAFLVHDRAIRTRTDDSVARSVRVAGIARPLIVRRSRGFVPESFDLPIAASRSVIACGADLKNTFGLAKGPRVWLGPHIGDLETEASLHAYEDGITHLARLFDVTPEVVAHDLHPDFQSTRYAERSGLPAIAVQHHHAHFAACLAEHGVVEPAVGVIYDGMGLGIDGTIWGGEFLLGDLAGFERIGHLRTVPQAGGDRATREPWRMACAWLRESFGAEALPVPALPERIGGDRWQAVAALAERRIAAPLTSSVGRLFDAVAALCHVRDEVSYEGQAAIELEALAANDEEAAYPLTIDTANTCLQLDPRPTIRAIVSDLDAGLSTRRVSARFHNALARATIDAAIALIAAHNVSNVVLSGGVFQNRRLLDRVSQGLTDAGMSVLVPQRLPVNDGAIAFGQIAVAAAQLSLKEGASRATGGSAPQRAHVRPR